MTPTAQQMRASLINYPRQLHWGNFRPINQSPSPPNLAQTQITYNASYRNVVLSQGCYVLSGVRVIVSLNMQGTWVVRNQQSDDLLRHEQGHYDITGLISRDLCREMLSLELDATVADSLPNTNSNVRQYAGTYLGAQFNRLYALTRSMSDMLQTHYVNGQPIDGLYDQQTNHGMDNFMQQKWDGIFQYANNNGNGLGMTMWVFEAITDADLGKTL